jgi:hypothetical protein
MSKATRLIMEAPVTPEQPFVSKPEEAWQYGSTNGGNEKWQNIES